MIKETENNKRIIKNTVFLYIRMIFLMGISLYTSRVVLSVLGIEDYGIYNVVSGLITMFSLISASISTSISRFLTYELGHGDTKKLNLLFCTAINIQAIMALLVFVAIEIIGFWFLNYKMTIPPERISAANWVFQCSMLTFVINLFSVPYNALIIAHERMKAFANVGIMEGLLKLLVAYLLILATLDKLKIYALLMLAVAVLIRITYGVYCGRHFSESHYHFVYNKSIMRELATFAGWNYVGTAAWLFRGQGLNLLINLFFGPAVNAARGLATQVETTTHQFVSNFTTALKPQIIKNYANGNKEYMYDLVNKGAKFSFFLMLIISIPIIYEAPLLLSLWLKTVPDYTVVFLRLTMIYSALQTLSSTLIISMQASSDIKKYQLTCGCLSLLIVPISYLLYSLGANAEMCYIVCIIMELCLLVARLFLLESMIGLSKHNYFKKVILKITPVAAVCFAFPILFCVFWQDGVCRLAALSFLSITFSLLIIYTLGLDEEEKTFLKERLQKYRNLKK